MCIAGQVALPGYRQLLIAAVVLSLLGGVPLHFLHHLRLPGPRFRVGSRSTFVGIGAVAST